MSLGFPEGLSPPGKSLTTIPPPLAHRNDEEKMYDYSKPTGFTHETGHFTQTVWKGTKQLGCAFARCDGIFGKGLGVSVACCAALVHSP